MLGSGVLKGLAVTFKNFVESYYKPERFVAVEYPDEKLPSFERFRNFPFLPYEGDALTDESIRCVACQICERECPPQCIYIEMQKDEQGRPLKRPAVFNIDVSVCMSCQICVEVCPFQAIYMDHEYELSDYGRFDELWFKKERLARPYSHHLRINPEEAKAAKALYDDRMAKERAKQQAAAAKAAAAAQKTAAPAKPASPERPSAAAPPADEGGERG